MSFFSLNRFKGKISKFIYIIFIDFIVLSDNFVNNGG